MARNVNFVADLKDLRKVFSRAISAKKENNSNKKNKVAVSNERSRERMSEREFVRAFGTKIKKVRYSNRADFVGLMVLGIYQGFVITSDDKGGRKIRLIDIDEKGVTTVTHRYLQVKSNESVSLLQRGLLNWVR